MFLQRVDPAESELLQFHPKRDILTLKSFRYVLAGDTLQHKWCRTWPGWETVQDDRKEDEDRLCYKPRRHHGTDYIFFNHLKRDLGEDGGQGPLWTNQTESEKACEGLCRNMDAVILKDETHIPSHQVMWFALEYVHL